MMLLCCRDHFWVYGKVARPLHHTSLGQWFLCQISYYPTARNIALLVGVLMADGDGEPLYWRARFWRPSFWRAYALAELRKEL